VNDVPLAVNDSGAGYSTNEDTGFTTADVLANDATGDPASSITAFDGTSVSGGTVTYNNDGTFDYTPATNFNGNDSFTYTITDLDGEMSTATVTITVNPPNNLPVGIPDITGTTIKDTTLTVDVSGISDAEGLGAFNYQWLRDGVAIGGANGATYTLLAADVGSLITVTTSYTDGNATAESVTSIAVGPVDDDEFFVDVVPEPPDVDTDNDPEPEPVEDIIGSETEAEGLREVLGETELSAPSFAVVNQNEFTIIPPLDIRNIDGLLSFTDNDERDRKPVPLKFFDLNNLLIARFESLTALGSSSSPLAPMSLMDNLDFLGGLDRMNYELNRAAATEQAQAKLTGEFLIGLTLSMTVGFVSWLLRAGSLLASFMSVAPLWKQFDPLPVLGAAKKKKEDLEPEDEKDAKVEEIFAGNNEHE
jgi:hypothetical protein